MNCGAKTSFTKWSPLPLSCPILPTLSLPTPTTPYIIIIMYIYHVLINALSAHMIHINLNVISYTHVEHSPTKTVFIKYYKKYFSMHYKHTHTLTVAEVRMEIL